MVQVGAGVGGQGDGTRDVEGLTCEAGKGVAGTPVRGRAEAVIVVVFVW